MIIKYFNKIFYRQVNLLYKAIVEHPIRFHYAMRLWSLTLDLVVTMISWLVTKDFLILFWTTIFFIKV